MHSARLFWRVFVGLALVLLTQGLAFADLVVMKNGDRLSGTILTLAEGLLELETDYAGVIKLQAAQIAEVSSEQPHELRLTSGEVLKGALTPMEGQRLQVGASADRAATVVDWAQVAALNPPAPQPSRWQGDLTLGGTMKSGNTDSRETTVAASGVRRTDRDRISLKLRYSYGEEDGERTAENTYGAMKYDYFVTKKLYTFLSLEFLIDQFKDLNLRTVVGPGLGYQLLDEEDRALALEAGVAYFNEDRDTAEDESWLTARLGANLYYRLFDWLVFRDDLLVYPSLETGGEYQLRNEASLSTALSSSWALNFTNIYEHDSQPAEGVDSDDLTWILGLQYAF